VVDQHVLSSRLDALESYLTELRTFRELDRERFVREPALHHLAERFLQLACESVLDVAHHVISDEGYRQARSYKDAMDVLRDEGLIESGLAERLKSWMGFRNVLVHLYMDIDHGRSYDAIRDDLGDLEEFASAMARLLRD
jgi:uncharacterized protein YutE (UPF0331/DUF86 family)